MAEQKRNGAPLEAVREREAGRNPIAKSLIVVPEPGHDYLEKNPAVWNKIGKAATTAMIEGCEAFTTDKDGKKHPDHKTRAAYLKLVIEMGGWSGDYRMKLRHHIQKIENDRLEYELKLNGVVPGGQNGKFQVSSEAARELG